MAGEIQVKGYVMEIIIILLLIISLILAYLYFSQRHQMTLIVENTIVKWREKELEILRKEQKEIAFKDALLQLESWRQLELDSSRKQQFENARNEVLVQFEQWKNEYTKEIRQDAIQKSQAVIAGKITEHFIPYLPEFTFNPKDARFLGTPIDYVIFNGLDEGDVKNVVFVEVKTGSSTMNTRERQVKDVIKAGKVEWMEMKPQLDFSNINIIETSKEVLPDPSTNNAIKKVKNPPQKRDTAKRLTSILKK